MKRKDSWYVPDPFWSRVKDAASRVICKITRRHSPQQKMYCVICKRCRIVLR